MKKKLLSVLLSTAMVAGLFAAVPLTASAEGDVEEITWMFLEIRWLRCRSMDHVLASMYVLRGLSTQ